LIILIAVTYLIYHTLTENKQLSFEEFRTTLQNSALFSPSNLLILLLFTVVNWILEITKWKLLANQIEPISWKSAAQQSLASLTFSLITPNRIGEYGAKALYFQKEKRKQILILNFIGNVHQFLVTFFIGFTGMYYWKDRVQEIIPETVYEIISAFLVFLIFILVLLNFNSRYVWWKETIFNKFIFVTKKLNIQVSIVSLLRYLVFSHQLFWALFILDIQMSYLITMATIASMYFISSLIPMLSLFDFVVKGSVAAFLFSLCGVSPLLILSVITLLWIYNFVIPAIIGSYFVLTFQPVES
jgi:uncharacterized membrane protein YbhN (UPF0104 family)